MDLCYGIISIDYSLPLMMEICKYIRTTCILKYSPVSDSSGMHPTPISGCSSLKAFRKRRKYIYVYIYIKSCHLLCIFISLAQQSFLLCLRAPVLSHARSFLFHNVTFTAKIPISFTGLISSLAIHKIIGGCSARHLWEYDPDANVVVWAPHEGYAFNVSEWIHEDAMD